MRTAIGMFILFTGLFIFSSPLVVYLFYPSLLGNTDISNILNYDMSIFLAVVSVIIFINFIRRININNNNEKNFFKIINILIYICVLFIILTIDCVFIKHISVATFITELFNNYLPEHYIFKIAGILFLLLTILYAVLSINEVANVLKRKYFKKWRQEFLENNLTNIETLNDKNNDNFDDFNNTPSIEKNEENSENQNM